MSKISYDPKHPVSHIEHEQEKRASIPTTERQGEESAIVDGQPMQSEYDVFCHELRRGIHFCGGDKKEFAAWKKGLESVAPKKAKKNAERTLRMEFPDDVWDSLYDFRSAPIKYERGRCLAVRVVSQFGEESTKVITME